MIKYNSFVGLTKFGFSGALVNQQCLHFAENTVHETHPRQAIAPFSFALGHRMPAKYATKIGGERYA